MLGGFGSEARLDCSEPCGCMRLRRGAGWPWWRRPRCSSAATPSSSRSMSAQGRCLELSDVAGTVAYHGRGRSASWSTRIELDAGAELVYAGQPFVVADGAEVSRTLRLDAAAGASAIIRETLILGRTGEVGGSVRNRSVIRREGVDLLVEDQFFGPRLPWSARASRGGSGHRQLAGSRRRSWSCAEDGRSLRPPGTWQLRDPVPGSLPCRFGAEPCGRRPLHPATLYFTWCVRHVKWGSARKPDKPSAVPGPRQPAEFSPIRLPSVSSK